MYKERKEWKKENYEKRKVGRTNREKREDGKKKLMEWKGKARKTKRMTFKTNERR